MTDVPYVLVVLGAILVAAWILRRLARRLLRLVLLLVLIGGAAWLWTQGDLSQILPSLAFPRE